MDEKDVLKEAQEVEKELDGIREVRKFSPLWYILAVFLSLLIIAMIVPYYSVKLDPEPSSIPLISEVLPADISVGNESRIVNNRNDFLLFVNPVEVKQVADRIVNIGCSSNKVCQAKALFYFVRDKFDYVSDPAAFEYVKSAKESLVSGGGDCDDASVLLLNLEEAIGIDSRFVFVPGHVYVEIKLDDALNRYKNKEGWIALDATCSGCEFGEVSFRSSKAEKSYLEV